MGKTVFFSSIAMLKTSRHVPPLSPRTKLEGEIGNDEDVAGPQEAKLKHMRKAIAELTKECSHMQKDRQFLGRGKDKLFCL